MNFGASLPLSHVGMIAKSDDFDVHGDVFVKATIQLVKDGGCTVAELKEIGGWWKSQEHKDKPIYFTYCGGMESIDTRLYLDASTGRVYR